MGGETGELRDRVAVVTGASSGIGKALALALARHEVRLALIGRRADALEEVARVARATTAVALPYPADLTQQTDIETVAAAVRRDFEFVDILIHAAAVVSLGRLEDASLTSLDQQYATNVRAPYALTQALLPTLRSRQGQIIFINSSSGHTARANTGQYAATKHALKAVADSLREEVNDEGLRVLSVFSGRTATPMQEAVHKSEGKAYVPERLQQPADVAAVVISALTLPRTAEITDVYMRPLIKP